MSVTFSCPEAPVIRRPDAYEEGAFEEVSTLPTINVSEFNSHALLELMQVPKGQYEVPHDKLGSVIDALTQVLTVPEARIAALEPASVNGQIAFTAPLDAVCARGTASDENSHADSQLIASKPQTLGELIRARLDLPVRKGPTMVYMGRDDDYIVRKATALKELFTLAQANKWSVCWG